jgi:3-oxoacyl-[acyl-carrier protein] reductase
MLRQRWGRIVNVSSTAAEDGMHGHGWYAVSKAALHGLTRTLLHEVSRCVILTNAVMLGPRLTERIEASVPPKVQRQWAIYGTSIGRMGRVDEAAQAIVFLASGANALVTGEVIRTGGRGPTSMAPWLRENGAT